MATKCLDNTGLAYFWGKIKSWVTSRGYITSSGSITGNAGTATKLATARSISAGDLEFQGSASFDGSGNIALNVTNHRCIVTVSNTNNYPFHRIAYVPVYTGSWNDRGITFLVSKDYNGGGYGIVRVIFRTNNAASQVAQCSIQWLCRTSDIAVNAIQVGFVNTAGASYLDVFYHSDGTYNSAVCRVLAHANARNGVGRGFTVVSASTEASSTTATDPKTSVESYKTIADAGTALHSQAYTDIIAASDAGVVGKLANARAISLTGDVSGSASFDGSANASITATVADDSHNHVISNVDGLQTALDGKAASSHSHAASDVTSGTFATERIPSLNASKITAGTFDAARIPSLDASKITSGTIDIARLPAGALERLVTVANQTARYALTTDAVQLGDVVKEMDTGLLYFVTDTARLDSDAGYTVFTAGSATSVPWSGVAGKPSTFPPSSHTHGNLTNDGKIGSTANLPLITTTSGKVTTGSFGSEANTFCQGNDSRLSDSRTPKSHTHGNITNAGAIGSTSGLPVVTGANGVLQAGSFGTTAGTVCEGNDSRLSNARTPTSHAHGSITNDGKLGTASRAVVTDGNGVIDVSSVTSTEMGCLSGVTSAIQTQLNAKALDSGVVHNTGNEAVGGTKTFSNNIRINNSSSGRSVAGMESSSGSAASFLGLSAYSSVSNGAFLRLYGKDNSSSPGDFVITASTGDSSSRKTLQGTATGTLTWDGQAIQTASDERLKTPVTAVPDEVLDAWGDVQWGQFQFLDAVERKGEAARLHLGLIAQRVKAAFDARGLDACQYGLLCHEVREAAEDEPAVDLWMVRYEEALAMEAAFQRRRADRLEERIRALEEASK